ncbi:hypothetical protein ACWDWS_02190 [Streptomyces sp. NPDC003328]
MGAIVNFLAQRWRAQPNNLIGGWSVTPKADARTPAGGAITLGDFSSEDIAKHVTDLHNDWLTNGDTE